MRAVGPVLDVVAPDNDDDVVLRLAELAGAALEPAEDDELAPEELDDEPLEPEEPE